EIAVELQRRIDRERGDEGSLCLVVLSEGSSGDAVEDVQARRLVVCRTAGGEGARRPVVHRRKIYFLIRLFRCGKPGGRGNGRLLLGAQRRCAREQRGEGSQGRGCQRGAERCRCAHSIPIRLTSVLPGWIVTV